CMVLNRIPGIDPELSWAGRIAAPKPSRGRTSFFSTGTKMGPLSDGWARHHGLNHCLAGADLRSVLDYHAGHSARVSAAHEHSSHLLRGEGPDLHALCKYAAPAGLHRAG